MRYPTFYASFNFIQYVGYCSLLLLFSVYLSLAGHIIINVLSTEEYIGAFFIVGSGDRDRIQYF